MNNQFPQYTASAQKGEAGVGLISRIIHDEFGWIFRRNHQEHDFGIDGHLEIVTDEGYVTGQMLAVQIKYGDSFFKEKNKWGYCFRGELKHFNYLANYPIPVLIIICNPESRECYWVRFEAENTTRTNGGWKLTIPFENSVSGSKDKLLSLLAPTIDSFAELEAYWSVNNLFVESVCIFFLIDKEDVNTFDIQRPRNFFNRLRKTKELAIECQGKVDFVFCGYDDDKREIYEITEIRKYVQSLCKELTELFYFGRTTGPYPALPALAMCLTSTKHEVSGDGLKVFYDTRPIGDFIKYQFHGLNEMTEWLGMNMEQNKELSDSALRCLGLGSTSN